MKKDIFFSFLSGLLLTLSFPNFNLWFFAWFGFVPLFFAIKDKSKIKAFLLTYLTGIIFWSGTIYWLIHVTLLGTILLVLYLALYFGVFALFLSSIQHPASSIQMLSIPTIWVLLEYLRSYLFTGFPWAPLGYSQYLNLPIIQIADIAGVWGVSFLVMMVNVAIYSRCAMRYALCAMRKKQKKSLVPTHYLFSFLLLFLSLSYGLYNLRRTYSAERTAQNVQRRTFKVSVIQGNIPQELKWDPKSREFIMDKYFTLTKEAAKGEPDLIIWPEAASPGLLGEDEQVPQEILTLSKKIKIPLLIGTVTVDNEKYFNSALLINSRGECVGRYDKLHLVPFGEYIPLKRTLPFLKTIVPIGDITPGKDYTVFTHNAGCRMQDAINFSVLICFEDLFPNLSREFIKRGVDFLVNITNDAWYKQSSAAYQHLQASVFRAVENRVWLARAANTGISGFIRPNGKIISLVQDKIGRNIFISGYDAQKIVILERKNLTFYTRYGDVFILFCAIFTLSSMIVAIKIGRK